MVNKLECRPYWLTARIAAHHLNQIGTNRRRIMLRRTFPLRSLQHIVAKDHINHRRFRVRAQAEKALSHQSLGTAGWSAALDGSQTNKRTELSMLGTILIIILILLLVGAIPSWGYSRSWGYGPSGGLGLVLIIVLILVLTGRI
jgi:hypothetical protein